MMDQPSPVAMRLIECSIRAINMEKLKYLFLQDDVWCTRCVELLSAPAFNPSSIPGVAPSALREYLGLTSTRQLYIALIHLPCVPVGIWYRTDATVQPDGELVSVHADGRGLYKMSPLDYTGGVVKQVELMRTDFCATSCAQLSVCSNCALGTLSLTSRKQRRHALVTQNRPPWLVQVHTFRTGSYITCVGWASYV